MSIEQFVNITRISRNKIYIRFVNVFLRVVTYYPFVKIYSRLLGKSNLFQNCVSSNVDPMSIGFQNIFRINHI